RHEKTQRSQNPGAKFTLQARARLGSWRLSRSRRSRGRRRSRSRRSLCVNYIFPGCLVRSKVINELTLNRRFALVSSSVFQEQIAFLRVKCEHLIHLVHERTKFFFK